MSCSAGGILAQCVDTIPLRCSAQRADSGFVSKVSERQVLEAQQTCAVKPVRVIDALAYIIHAENRHLLRRCLGNLGDEVFGVFSRFQTKAHTAIHFFEFRSLSATTVFGSVSAANDTTVLRSEDDLPFRRRHH